MSLVAAMTQPNDSTATLFVVLSASVALYGSLCCGCTLGYTSPARSGIIQDLGLSVATTMWFSEIVSMVGWFSIAFAKVFSPFFMTNVVH